MHKLVLRLFDALKSFIYFLRIVCVFCILLLCFFWVQNLLNSDWIWLSFIKPFFCWLLEVSDNMCSASFDLFGVEFELKYLTAIIIIIMLSLALKFLSSLVDPLKDIYIGTRNLCKKAEENAFNAKLHSDMKKEQTKIHTYAVTIHTKIKSKYSNDVANVNLDEQNMLMNKFISDNLGVKPMIYQGGYMYSFNDFDKIDRVLDVLFRVMNSSAPISYAICIQIDNNYTQLNKIIELKTFGKIITASDTAYRYSFNKDKNYQLSQAGLFQYEGDTLELHEFKQGL